MNAIQTALRNVLHQIPKDVLNYAFKEENTWDMRYPVSIESRIRNKVIDDRVLPDCNLVGGIQIEIPLKGLSPTYNDGSSLVFKIPKTKTKGKTITSILAVSNVGLRGSNDILMDPVSPLLYAAKSVMNAQTLNYSNSECNAEIIGENTIMLQDITQWTDFSLRCYVTNDEQMGNLNPRSFPAFSKMVVMAVKAYIYNNVNIPMDRGALYGGVPIGRLREVIDGYADANELYEEYLNNTWPRVAFLDDRESKRRHLAMISR